MAQHRERSAAPSADQYLGCDEIQSLTKAIMVGLRVTASTARLSTRVFFEQYA